MIGNHIELNFAKGLRMNLEDNKIFEILKSVNNGQVKINDYEFELVLKACNIGYIEIEENQLKLTDFGRFVVNDF